MTDKKFDRRTLLKSIGGASIVSVVGCLGSNGPTLTLGASGSGTSTTESAQAYTRAIEETDAELNLTVEQGGGWVSNTQLYNNGELNAIGTDNNTVAQARQQAGPFEEDPVDVLPAQGFQFTSNHLYLMGIEGSGLESTADISQEHTVYPLQPGWGTRLLTEEVLQRAGIEERAEYINVDMGDLPGAIEEGRVDAIAVYSSNFNGIPGHHQEIDARADVYALESSDSLIQAIEETPGARHETIEPYGWEQGVTSVTDEVHSWVLDAQWFFGPDADSDSVYELAKLSHEHTDVIQEAAPQYPDHSDVETMASAIIEDFPVHEAVADFYEEEGVWQDDWTRGNEYEI